MIRKRGLVLSTWMTPEGRWGVPVYRNRQIIGGDVDTAMKSVGVSIRWWRLECLKY